ncbi:hypothetical protein BN59_02069 [Legionella massiliensis]|uniref:Glycosyltransferase RgtA/B/C/D-like domain-containing protein n=2 Tax=Legionella massiliensis TaxID=1034943 RepID=A0A078L166_9GAMM|nr:hypothetical protein BN59_02069 [Legionella massiliensis]CEE13517.1 hypothetical protein BN1094_02069 [Legionella massiliensis]
MQSHLALNHDVGWLLKVAKRLLNGGHDVGSFFENNLPLIIYLYLPALLLSKITSLNILLSFRIYIYILASISFLICYKLSKRIFHNAAQNLFVKRVFMLTLLYCFLIHPAYLFGQREHLVLIFTMPYFFMMAIRFRGEEIKASSSLLIGLFSGLGFLIKPYFLLPLILLECYYLFLQRKIHIFRTEILAIVIVFITYFLCLFTINLNYIEIVLPYIWRWYYLGNSYPAFDLMVNGRSLFCLFLAVVFFAFPKKENIELLQVLIIALIGFWLSYFVQGFGWSYHILPAFSLALLIAVLLFVSVSIEQASQSLKTSILSLSILSLFFILEVAVIWDDYKKHELSATLLKKWHDELLLNKTNNAVYALTTAAPFFPASYYIPIKVSTRFSSFWMLPSMVKWSYMAKTGISQEQRERDVKFLGDMVAQDLRTIKPGLVFVDVSPKKWLFQWIQKVGFLQYRYKYLPFNYLDFFSQNQQFNREWKNYYYYKTADIDGTLYAIYQRKQVNAVAKNLQ